MWRSVVDRLKHDERVLRLADRLGRSQGRWRPIDALVDPPLSPPLNLRELNEAFSTSSGLAACWIGHATTLLRIRGRTILTDPIFSNRVGITLGPMTVGPRRLVAPAVPMRHLPVVDLIAISHAHFDHLDLPSLRELRRRQPDVPVVTARGCGDLLKFKHVIELSPNERATVAGVDVRAHPVNHWTARVFHDTWRGACGFSFERSGGHVLFCGDTAMTQSFDGLRPDLMCVGIGAYDPYVASHATPEQAWAMAVAAEAESVVAMHHATFRLSYEPTAEPMRRFLQVAGGSHERVACRQLGSIWKKSLTHLE